MEYSGIDDAIDAFDMTSYIEQYQQVEEYRKDFVKRFSLDRIRTMEIDEYVQGKRITVDNFCYELEWKLGSLGHISGSRINKFGIFYSQKRNQYEATERWKRNTIKESMLALRQELASLIEAGECGDMELIRKAPFSPMFKGKILATYYPEKYLSVFSLKHIEYFIHKLGLDHLVKPDYGILDKRCILVGFMRSDQRMNAWPLHAFAHLLYNYYPKAPKGQVDNSAETLKIDTIAGDFISLEDKPSNRRSGKADYELISRNNAALGERGEFIVMKHEKRKLKDSHIKKVPEQVSKKDDSCGYDIKSFDNSGEEIFIEVKTTNSLPNDFRIFITSNEFETARELGNKYHLYVVFNPNSSNPKIYDMGNPFIEEGKAKLIPVTYKLHLRKL